MPEDVAGAEAKTATPSTRPQSASRQALDFGQVDPRADTSAPYSRRLLLSPLAWARSRTPRCCANTYRRSQTVRFKVSATIRRWSGAAKTRAARCCAGLEIGPGARCGAGLRRAAGGLVPGGAKCRPRSLDFARPGLPPTRSTSTAGPRHWTATSISDSLLGCRRAWVGMRC